MNSPRTRGLETSLSLPMTLCVLSRVAMAEQERHDFVRSTRHSLLDLARRIEHASSTDVVEYVIGRLRQISRHLLRLEGAEGLTPTALPLFRAVDVLHIHSLLLQQYSVDSAAVVVVQPQITLTIRLQESCAPLQLGYLTWFVL